MINEQSGDGASGVNYEDICPICGKERGANCQNTKELIVCPNNKACKNNIREEYNGKQKYVRKGCVGYSDGSKGLGSRLGRNILTATYGIPKEAKSPTKSILLRRLKKATKGTSDGIDKGSHPLYVGQDSIQAHHLICSEFMDDENQKWKNVCEITGYNVNCKLNGIFLPADMRLACYLKIQRHAGSHYMGKGVGKIENQKYIKSYVDAVESELNCILSTFSHEKTKKKCKPSDVKDLVQSMNDLSGKICKKIKTFSWTIAWDSSNYAPESPRIGCANERSLPKKKERLFSAFEKELKEQELIPESLNKVRDVSKAWKSLNYDDMDKIQKLVRSRPKTICCKSKKEHEKEFGLILKSKTKKYFFKAGY